MSEGFTDQQMATNDMSAIPHAIAIAHELKAPLAVIHYLTSVLGDTSLQILPSERDQMMERIHLMARRMSRLVEGLTRSYGSAWTSEQLDLFGMEPVNVVPIIDAAIDELYPLARNNQQSIEAHYRSRRQTVIANRDILHLLIVNLIDNALRHSKENQAIAVGTKNRGEFLQIDVRDFGAPLSQKEFTKMRSGIHKEAHPASARIGSSGLGLYIANELSHSMGGLLGAIRHTQGVTVYTKLRLSTQLSLVQ